jgi:endonuclease/exonuclease/phosphatase (EEP) superfamily protein YafD
VTIRNAARAVTLIGLLVALPAAVLTVSRAVEGSIHGFGFRGLQPIPELAAFAPWALPLWVIAGVLLLIGVGRRVRTAVAVFVVAGGAIAVGVYWQLPSGAARDATASKPTAATTSGMPVRLMTLNAELGQADAAEALNQVSRHQVDVLVVEELTPELVARLRSAGIDRLLRYSDLRPQPGAAGTGVWSRWGIIPGGVLPSQGFEMPAANVVLPASPNGTGVSGQRLLKVTAVHAMSPIRYQIPIWRRDLSMIAAVAAHRDSFPTIYAGDFNASRDHAEFRAILNTGLIDAADAVSGAPWTSFTWPADKPGPAFTRLDHVLVTPGTIAVRKVTVITVAGTDHHGVIADLQVSA